GRAGGFEVCERLAADRFRVLDGGNRGGGKLPVFAQEQQTACAGLGADRMSTDRAHDRVACGTGQAGCRAEERDDGDRQRCRSAVAGYSLSHVRLLGHEFGLCEESCASAALRGRRLSRPIEAPAAASSTSRLSGSPYPPGK